MTITIPVDTLKRRASEVMDDLVDNGPSTSKQVCERLGLSPSQFSSAVTYARDNLCKSLGIALPAPTPGNGWLYHATMDWETVEASAAYSMGQIERRLERIYGDVQVALPHLTRGTVAWRRAKFLEKHIDHIVKTLGEING